MAQKGKEIFNKVLQSSKGAGIGVGLITAGLAGAYGFVNSIFTGFFKFFILC